MSAWAERVLEAAALRAGDTVLDVGAASGELTLAAHERIGDGWVIAVDPSVDALENLLRLAHAVSANGIMYLVGDAGVLPLPNASVDVAVLGSALVHVADTGSAARELARVLRPGGRLSLHDPLQRAGELQAELEACGFADVEAAMDDRPPPGLFLSARRS